ncbi:protein MGARP isoform X6 [Denticeps clupeoides]|uniref:protein MGARP isoform X6 n=1 Tax=Denticeps clupeoides TaxID=299321 RepID=UPI0010A5329A|nr:protein MGARP isoform X6 [Denticeps clupeoides]
MYLCRAALQRCGPMGRRPPAYSRLTHVGRNVVPRRTMSSSVPGGSGENIVYALLCGGALVGGLSYAYSTVKTDHARYTHRITEIQARPKAQWEPKPWPPKVAGTGSFEQMMSLLQRPAIWRQRSWLLRKKLPL